MTYWYNKFSHYLFVCALVLVLSHADHVCYDSIGCFNNLPPYLNGLGKLPHSPDHIGILFHLHTRQNLNSTNIDKNDTHDTLITKHFDGGRKTVFIVHGFHGEENDNWISPMTNALLKEEDVNGIVVIWTKGAYEDYNQAVANTRVVGAVIADMVTFLHNTVQLDYGLVHLVGHSLGAHACGYAGERLHGLSRITGLDPAGPLFKGFGKEVRLDTTDALFVDIIQSDEVLGYGSSIGHVDFYPNGGTNQPGCLFDPLAPFYSCSHLRATFYFTESISTSCHFTSHPCSGRDDYSHHRCTGCGNGCETMGYHVSRTAHGNYYLNTSWHYPYCTGIH